LYQLKDGDEIKIGATQFKYNLLDAPELPAEEESSDGTPDLETIDISMSMDVAHIEESQDVIAMAIDTSKPKPVETKKYGGYGTQFSALSDAGDQREDRSRRRATCEAR
jgi:hypothetical protein